MRANTMTKDQDEPSMEDILSSIRQIISEDDSGAQAPANSDTPRKELQSDREIIDLIHQLKEDGTVEKIQPFSETIMTKQEEETVMAKEAQEISADDLITDVLDEKSTDDEGSEEDGESSNDDVIDLDGDGEGEGDEGEATTETLTSEISKTAEEDLMSESALSEAASALESLSRITAASHTQTQTGGLGDKSVEGLVKDVLRPILKDWLDANLPSYVRAIVTEQVEKVIRENNKKAS